MRNNDKIAVIDIGTTKVCTIIVELKQDLNFEKNIEIIPNDKLKRKSLEKINLLGVGISASKGLANGKIGNVIDLSKQLNKSIEKAEKISNVDFSEVKKTYLGISSAKTKVNTTTGMDEINGEVTEENIKKAIYLSKLNNKNYESEILHSIPNKYFVDNDKVSYPLDMRGKLLKIETQIINVSKNQIANFKKVLEKNNIFNHNIILQLLANKEAVLNDDEIEMGTLLIDIGGGTTDIGIFKEGGIEFVDILETGGEDFTKEIALKLQTNIYEAEKIKRNFSKLKNEKNKKIKYKDASNTSEHVKDCKEITKIIDEKIEDLIFNIKESLYDVNIEGKGVSNIVITGGGSTISNLKEKLNEEFNLPIRVATPDEKFLEKIGNYIDKEYFNIKSNKSAFSTISGLLFMGIKDNLSSDKHELENSNKKKKIKGQNIKKDKDQKMGVLKNFFKKLDFWFDKCSKIINSFF